MQTIIRLSLGISTSKKVLKERDYTLCKDEKYEAILINYQYHQKDF